MDEVQEAAVLETEITALGANPTARQLMDTFMGYSDSAVQIALKRTGGGAAPGGSGGWVGPFTYRWFDTVKVVTSGADGGTFTLTVDGQTTAGIAWDADAAAVLAALVALPNVAPADVNTTSPNNVSVSGVTVEWGLGFLAAPITGDGSGLTGVGAQLDDLVAQERTVELQAITAGGLWVNAACFRTEGFGDASAALAVLQDADANPFTPGTGWPLKNSAVGTGGGPLYFSGSTTALEQAGLVEAALVGGAGEVWLPTIALETTSIYLHLEGANGETEGAFSIYLNIQTPTPGGA